MNFRLRHLLIIALLFAGVPATGQTKTKEYTITSLEGKMERIIVKNDFMDTRLRIIHNRDTLMFFDNWYGEVKVTALTKNFLQIVFSRRGGSGIHVDDLLLICMQHGKPHVALEVMSAFLLETGDILDDYSTKVSVESGAGTNLCLKAVARYKTHGSDAKGFRKTAYLKFDNVNSVFFTEREQINESFLVYNYADTASIRFFSSISQPGKPGMKLPKQSDKFLKRFEGQYCTVKINPQNYYFDKGIWYSANSFIGTGQKRPTTLYRTLK